MSRVLARGLPPSTTRSLLSFSLPSPYPLPTTQQALCRLLPVMSASPLSTASAPSATPAPATPASSLTTHVTDDEKHAVAKSFESVKERVAKAVAKYSATPSAAPGIIVAPSPRLVAVSKTKPIGLLQAVYDAGNRHFGENYVQELVAKAAMLPSDIQWHFIGHLQSNKAAAIAGIPNLYMVETVDSAKLAGALEKACIKHARPQPLPVLIQVNSSGEGSKSGVEPGEIAELAHLIRKDCPHLKLAGLMTIGQPGRQCSDEHPNPDFQLLHTCRKQLAAALAIPETDLELSFGMSDDFEHAISMGSTNVRVGSTIFGARVYPQMFSAESS